MEKCLLTLAFSLQQKRTEQAAILKLQLTRDYTRMGYKDREGGDRATDSGGEAGDLKRFSFNEL